MPKSAPLAFASLAALALAGCGGTPESANEAAIDTLLSGQLYTVIGRSDAEGRWQLRLWWKPLVTLIWFGGGLIGLGGLLALAGHARRAWRRRMAQ